MNTITIALPDDCLLKLKEKAPQFNVSPEELVRVSIEGNRSGARHLQGCFDLKVVSRAVCTIYLWAIHRKCLAPCPLSNHPPERLPLKNCSHGQMKRSKLPWILSSKRMLNCRMPCSGLS